MQEDVKAMLVNNHSLLAIWRQIDVNNSGTITTSEWHTWVQSRWNFVTAAAMKQAFQRTLASSSTAQRQPALQQALSVTPVLFERLVQTLPICCEAEAMFAACDADNDHRVTSAELKKHSKSHGLNLNADQLKQGMRIFGSGAGFSSFCDWYIEQRGGDTAQEIAAVWTAFVLASRYSVSCCGRYGCRSSIVGGGSGRRVMAHCIVVLSLTIGCRCLRQREKRGRP
jgi:hypothetical protein